MINLVNEVDDDDEISVSTPSFCRSVASDLSHDSDGEDDDENQLQCDDSPQSAEVVLISPIGSPLCDSRDQNSSWKLGASFDLHYYYTAF